MIGLDSRIGHLEMYVW